jgi:hypothetical protein
VRIEAERKTLAQSPLAPFALPLRLVYHETAMLPRSRGVAAVPGAVFRFAARVAARPMKVTPP